MVYKQAGLYRKVPLAMINGINTCVKIGCRRIIKSSTVANRPVASSSLIDHFGNKAKPKPPNVANRKLSALLVVKLPFARISMGGSVGRLNRQIEGKSSEKYVKQLW